MSEEAKAAGETVGKTVENVVSSTEASAQSAIDEAKRKADEAVKTAEQLASAALHTDLGQRVSSHEERISKWQEENEQTKHRLSLMEQTSQSLSQSLSAVSSTLEKLTQTLTQPVVAVAEKTGIVEPEKSNTTKMEASDRKEEGNREASSPGKRTRLFL